METIGQEARLTATRLNQTHRTVGSAASMSSDHCHRKRTIGLNQSVAPSGKSRPIADVRHRRNC